MNEGRRDQVFHSAGKDLADKTYTDASRQVKVVLVRTGDYCVSVDGSTLLSTVLGSCVTVCLYDAGRGVGGMNHFLLPHDGKKLSPGLKNGDRRATLYGAYSMELLINQMLKMGAMRTGLRAKVVGGGQLVRGPAIGAQNVDFVLNFLGQEGIPVVSQHVGGQLARKVEFSPVGGQGRVRRISCPTLLAQQEYNFLRSVQDRSWGEVEFFD